MAITFSLLTYLRLCNSFQRTLSCMLPAFLPKAVAKVHTSHETTKLFPNFFAKTVHFSRFFTRRGYNHNYERAFSLLSGLQFGTRADCIRKLLETQKEQHKNISHTYTILYTLLQSLWIPGVHKQDKACVAQNVF